MDRSLELMGVEGPRRILVTYRFDWRVPCLELDTPDFHAFYRIIDRDPARVVAHDFNPGWDGYQVRCELSDVNTHHDENWGSTAEARVRHCRDNWKLQEAMRLPLDARLNRVIDDVLQRQGWTLRWPDGCTVMRSERNHLVGALAHVIRTELLE